ncbi:MULTISPECIES: GNAT family N-acetyltransferase [Kitasatospora]|uniref:RimJ/RimL family protein N-acetyltransferase n=2 Tax=Kitasatospora TaxID=2063 RepID=A0ABT1J8E7_9ACTN|nr:GNAT family protein [Kitasatospora paracochleata]MCP2313336.1 RimJ/RimL family protein N-acetyltransferase [Kitasatospora paracochleata]
MTAKLPAPITLTGRHVRLEPLTRAHTRDLFTAGGGDEEVWRWVPVPVPRTPEEMADTVDARLADRECTPFAVVDLGSGRAIGVTCYFDADAAEEQVEIGGTWYARSAWRSAVNTESKLLLLTHAFEDLGMGRIYWKTDHLNERSQNAIRRLGATYEGTFRRSKQRPDGSWRDSVYFSMLGEEWPAAKARLTERLAAG